MKNLISPTLGISFIIGTFAFGGEIPESPITGFASNPDLEATPEGLSDADWSGIRAAYEGTRHAITADADGTYRARNSGQAWVTRFDGRGFTVNPHAGDWEWGLELKGFGEVTKILNEGEKLSYVRDGGLVEWFINDSRGLEQGWTFPERPKDAEPGTLRLRLGVRGGLSAQVAASGASTSFLDPLGSSVLTYGGLKAWDADGERLCVRFVEDGVSIVVEVNDEGARYPLTIDPIAQQAYLKASNTGSGDLFGWSVAASGDTVVVGAKNEDSNATGINGDEADNLASQSGAAYVFVRDGETWRQEAYLKASNTGPRDSFGASVAVSGDTVVVGAPSEASTGAAYVFVRNGTNWSQEAYLKASNTGPDDSFGASVAVSGDTIVVGARREDSNATGINGDEADNSASQSGAAYVFVRDGETWRQEAYLKASNTGLSQFGASVAVSGDTVVVGAPSEAGTGAAYVFVRNGTNWSQEAYLKASNTGRSDCFGEKVAISSDTVVVGAFGEDSNATGINGDEADNSALYAGAAYVFVRDGTTWSQEAYLKASNTKPDNFFGASVAVSGITVIVGARGEESSSTGVNGDETSNSALYAGAAYVFVRRGTTWSQEAYLKASNTDSSDFFGRSVAISSDAIVVGASDESSSATGINGNEGDNSAREAGAAYVFDVPLSYSLFNSATNGNINGFEEYFAGDTATLTAIPEPGFIFDSWTGDVASSNNPLDLVMDSDKTLIAHFVRDTSDTDGDALSAYEELVVYGTNPGQSDTDGDGLSDGYEVGIGRYSVALGLFTWTQAKAASEDLGGHLATFTSHEEWDVALRSIGSDALDGVTGAWIGATDADEEGSWTWITGEPFVFNNWADGQPDDFNNSDVAEVSGGFGVMPGKWFGTGGGVAREGYLLEVGYATDPTIADSDGDGLNDGNEKTAGSNPFLIDTDGDTISDGADAFPLDPNEWLDTDGDSTGDNADTDDDGDGLTDVEEVNLGTDPLLADTDGDSFSDGTDTFPLDLNEWFDTDGDSIGNNSDTDDDGDGLTDVEEVNLGTDPLLVDTDGDTIPDDADTFPLDLNEWLDNDGDFIGDNADLDDDNDGLTDVAEIIQGTNPFLADSDGDGLNDGAEIDFLLNPLIPDTDGDGILDGEEDEDFDSLSNALEAELGTSPFTDDTDSDGLKDQQEVNIHMTDPTERDTDHDLLEDGLEINITFTDPLKDDTDDDGIKDSDENPDGDHYTNFEEVVIFQTDPFDPQSRFDVEFGHTSQNHSLSFPTLLGRAYRVERTVNISDPTKWNQVVTFGGTGNSVAVPLGRPIASRWFYRVVVSLD